MALMIRLFNHFLNFLLKAQWMTLIGEEELIYRDRALILWVLPTDYINIKTKEQIFV